MKTIVLASGNVTPALSEQEEYYNLRFGIHSLNSRTKRRYGQKYHYPPRPLRPWDISNSGESTFVQHGIEPKEVSEKEQSKRDWRESKGFDRDRQKLSSDSPRYRKAAVREQNQWDRQHSKQLIRTQKWDEILTRDEPRDRWSWD